MKWSWTVILMILLVPVLLAPTLAGEVYTWTDADGNVHITDRPPKDRSQVESVIRYSNQPETIAQPDPAPQQVSVETQQAEKLKKQLKRLQERKTQLEKIIAENQASIAEAEKDAARYRRRSGSSIFLNISSFDRTYASGLSASR